MKPGAQKAKGNGFERETAKELSRWYFGDENALIRTQSSGAMATVRQIAIGLNDIMQISHHEDPFPFCVECKHLKKAVTFHDLFSEKSLFRKAWTQATTAATLTPGSDALLIFRANGKMTLASLHKTTFDKLGLVMAEAHATVWWDETGARVLTAPLEAMLTVYNAKRAKSRERDAA